MFVNQKSFSDGLQYRVLYASGISAKTKKPNPIFIMHNGLYKIAEQVINPLDKEQIIGYEIPSKSYYSCNAAVDVYLKKVNVENGGVAREGGNPDFIDKWQMFSKLEERLVYEC